MRPPARATILAGDNLLDRAQQLRIGLAGPERILGAHRVAIHRGAVEGGTSIEADGGFATTRPAASPSGTRLVRSIGATASSISASVSSSGIVSRMGRMVCVTSRS
jgi:UDP-N-acetylglucosamine enolpyruvyl transferase